MPESVTTYRAADYDELAELRSWAERARAEHGDPLPRHLSVSCSVSLELVERLLRAVDRPAPAPVGEVGGELPQNPTPIEWASTPVADRIRDAIHNLVGHAMGGTLGDLVEAAVIGMAEAGLIARLYLADKTDAHHRGLEEFEDETLTWFRDYALKLDPVAVESDAEPRDVVQAALDAALAATPPVGEAGEPRLWWIWSEEDDHLRIEAPTVQEAVERWVAENDDACDGGEVTAFDLAQLYTFEVVQTNADDEDAEPELAVKLVRGPAASSPPSADRVRLVAQIATTLGEMHVCHEGVDQPEPVNPDALVGHVLHVAEQLGWRIAPARSASPPSQDGGSLRRFVTWLVGLGNADWENLSNADLVIRAQRALAESYGGSTFDRLAAAASPPSEDGGLRSALAKLLDASGPYIAKAAPHEQLFDGEDHRNFNRLAAARVEALEALVPTPPSSTDGDGRGEIVCARCGLRSDEPDGWTVAHEVGLLCPACTPSMPPLERVEVREHWLGWDALGEGHVLVEPFERYDEWTYRRVRELPAGETGAGLEGLRATVSAWRGLARNMVKAIPHDHSAAIEGRPTLAHCYRCRLDATIKALPSADGPGHIDVFARDECLFHFCPHPEHCRERCVSEEVGASGAGTGAGAETFVAAHGSVPQSVVDAAIRAADSMFPDESAPAGESAEPGEGHSESMARGLALQAEFIASVRAALDARETEFTDREIWQEALRIGPIEPADLASHLLQAPAAGETAAPGEGARS